MSAPGLPCTSPASEAAQQLPASCLWQGFPGGTEGDAPPYVIIDTDAQVALLQESKNLEDYVMVHLQWQSQQRCHDPIWYNFGFLEGPETSLTSWQFYTLMTP